MTAATILLVTTMAMIAPLLKMLAADLGVSVGQAGQLGTMTALPWAVTALLAGPVIDRRGGKRVLALSLFALGVVTCASAAAPSYGSLLVLRVLMGVVGGAGPSAVTTIVGERVAPARRGRALGWVFSGFGIAAIAAVPAVGAVAGVFGWRVAFAFVGALLIALSLIVHLWLADDVPRAPPAMAPRASRAWGRVLRTHKMGLVIAANVHERLAYSSCSFYLATFLMDRYHLDSVSVAVPLSLAAGGAVAGNVLGGQLADRLDRAAVYAATLCVSACFAIALFEAPLHLVVTTALAALFGIANSASRPAFMSIATQMSPEHRGTAMGIISSSSQAGWALGAALGGVAIELGSTHGLAALTAGTSVLAALWMLPLRGRAVAASEVAPAARSAVEESSSSGLPR